MRASCNPNMDKIDSDTEEDQQQNKQEENIKEYLEIQIQEIEMLQSMFSNPGEFTMFDESILYYVIKYINNETNILPNHLDFTVNISVNDIKLEICIHLPHEYPHIEPEIFVRSNQLNRTDQTKLNENLREYINSLEKDAMCLYTIVSWIQDNVLLYHTSQKDSIQDCNIDNKTIKFDVFTRYWIYSHHIYSKVKRKTMLDLSSDLNITGFCLPGKPGIICIEGTAVDCEDWWHRIRSMTWKKIMCKTIEEIKVKNLEEFNSLRRFEDFKEISFLNSKTNCKQDFHMDMGEFYKYLEDNHSAYMFKEYFGFDGKKSR